MSIAFPQNVIAIMWDFDRTLTPGYMQEPLFKRFKVNWENFLNQREDLIKTYSGQGIQASRDVVLLNLILHYVKIGRFKNLDNKLLRTLGSQIKFYVGLPGFFKVLKDNVNANMKYQKYGISLEHYIISTGLRQMILGSSIAQHVDGVWGCEYSEGATRSQNAKIAEIAYFIDDTTKTRAVFEINKGHNKDPNIDVNAQMDESVRRVPFKNMIYVADGPSDIPVFSIINRFEGRTYAVYKPGLIDHFNQAKKLQDTHRVHSFGEAIFTSPSKTYLWLLRTVQEIADRIVIEKDTALAEKVSGPPQHLG